MALLGHSCSLTKLSLHCRAKHSSRACRLLVCIILPPSRSRLIIRFLLRSACQSGTNAHGVPPDPTVDQMKNHMYYTNNYNMNIMQSPSPHQRWTGMLEVVVLGIPLVESNPTAVPSALLGACLRLISHYTITETLTYPTSEVHTRMYFSSAKAVASSIW